VSARVGPIGAAHSSVRWM